LHLSAASLNFADALERFFYPSWVRLSEGLFALSALLATGGYVAAFLGFRRPGSRRRLLGRAAILFAASGAAELADHVNRSVQYAGQGAIGTVVAAEIVGAAASLAFLVAGAVAAVAFLSSREAPGRDLVLGWAAVMLVAFYALSFVSGLLYAVAYSDVHAPGGFAGGLAVQAAGAALAAFGAVAAAIAFRRPGPNGEQQRLADRDGLLGQAATTIGLGYLLSAIGAMVYAGSVPGLEIDTKAAAANWLSGVDYLGLACAAICAGIAFRASRPELEDRDGPDLAALADPA
jgi:hypothetical protein